MQVEVGIDVSTWQVALLPLPKRFARSKALGFCGGHAVGMAETSRGKSAAAWWPNGEPELLALAGQKDLIAMRASGRAIPGAWKKGATGRTGAVVWGLHGSALVGTDLHVTEYEKTWAEAAGGGCVVGVGIRKGTLAQRGPDHGLVWREGADTVVIEDPAGDVALQATDGTRLAGHVGYRAVLWPRIDAPRIDLAPAPDYASSEVQALDGDLQIGFAFRGPCARAALWRGDPASFTDLTPDGYEASRAFGAARGWQVGLIRRTDTTRSGSSSLADQAVIWRGAANRWFNLNALLPQPFNASAAWAIEVEGDVVRVCGEASRYEVSDPGTDRESHFLPEARAAVWTGRVR